MPATVSSRSFGPDPEIRMTAGSAPVAPSGLDNVPASEKPLASMRTVSSFGRDIVRRRVETAAMSARATSRPCAGTRRRSNRPFSSAQTSVSAGGAPATWKVTAMRVALMTRSTVWMRSGTALPTMPVNEPCPG